MLLILAKGNKWEELKDLGFEKVLEEVLPIQETEEKQEMEQKSHLDKEMDLEEGLGVESIR